MNIPPEIEKLLKDYHFRIDKHKRYHNGLWQFRINNCVLHKYSLEKSYPGCGENMIPFNTADELLEILQSRFKLEQRQILVLNDDEGVMI